MKSEILNTTRFNKNSDLSTTYLGKTNMIRDQKIVVEEKFPNVRYYWIPKLANHLCLNHTIYVANHFIHYLSSHQKHEEFKWVMGNM